MVPILILFYHRVWDWDRFQFLYFIIFFHHRDLQQIQSGIGDKVGTTLQALATLFGGFIVAFVYGWKLALVMLAVCPLIVLSGALTGKVMASLTSKEQTAYAEAGAIAEQAISSIRTVVAFGGENEELKKYEKLTFVCYCIIVCFYREQCSKNMT